MTVFSLEEKSDCFCNGAFEKILPLRNMDDDARKEYWATLALRHCKGIGMRTRARLLNFYGTAFNALEMRKDWRNAKVNEECARQLAKEDWRKEAKKEWDAAAEIDAGILLWRNQHYPPGLRELPDAPSLLYCQGQFELLGGPAIAIVGSRSASENNLEIAYALAKALSKNGVTIVSGMASGIDRRAHLGALCEIGKSVGVLGTGIKMRYPASNRDLYQKMATEGLLISEFTPETPPAGMNFPIRNRIISGISLGVLVVEAAAKSGSLITANLALEQNREVFAIPGPAMNIRSLGCQNLIRQGAHPVFCVDDVMKELADRLKPYETRIVTAPEAEQEVDWLSFEPSNITINTKIEIETDFDGKDIADKQTSGEHSQAIMELLSAGPMFADVIARKLDMDVMELNSQLTFLEMLGRVRRLPGSRFEAV